MDNVEFLTVLQLADRLGVHPQTLARWRRNNQGPRFTKTEHPVRILYPVFEVEIFEKQNPSLLK